MVLGEVSQNQERYYFFLSPVIFLFQVRYFEHVFGAARFYGDQFFFVLGGISGFILFSFSVFEVWSDVFLKQHTLGLLRGVSKEKCCFL